MLSPFNIRYYQADNWQSDRAEIEAGKHKVGKCFTLIGGLCLRFNNYQSLLIICGTLLSISCMLSVHFKQMSSLFSLIIQLE